MTSVGLPEMMNFLPNGEASPANRVRHRCSLMIATGGAFGASSASVKDRPMIGRSRREHLPIGHSPFGGRGAGEKGESDEEERAAHRRIVRAELGCANGEIARRDGPGGTLSST